MVASKQYEIAEKFIKLIDGVNAVGAFDGDEVKLYVGESFSGGVGDKYRSRSARFEVLEEESDILHDRVLTVEMIQFPRVK